MTGTTHSSTSQSTQQPEENESKLEVIPGIANESTTTGHGEECGNGPNDHGTNLLGEIIDDKEMTSSKVHFI